jgi:hypothetical protein
MKPLLNYIPIISLCIGAWMILNGILHDIFVLISDHGKKYDRDLLRLLMDGHVLITCGVLQMLAYTGLKNGGHLAYYIVAVACISMLIYCGMIWPFLKSVFTILLNLILLILLIINFSEK